MDWGKNTPIVFVSKKSNDKESKNIAEFLSSTYKYQKIICLEWPTSEEYIKKLKETLDESISSTEPNGKLWFLHGSDTNEFEAFLKLHNIKPARKCMRFLELLGLEPAKSGIIPGHRSLLDIARERHGRQIKTKSDKAEENSGAQNPSCESRLFTSRRRFADDTEKKKDSILLCACRPGEKAQDGLHEKAGSSFRLDLNDKHAAHELFADLDGKYWFAIEAWLNNHVNWARGVGHFIVSTGAQAGRCHLHLRAVSGDGDTARAEQQEISECTDFLLNACLAGQRPVASWRSNFLLPVFDEKDVLWKKSKDFAKNESETIAADSRTFFTHEASKIIFCDEEDQNLERQSIQTQQLDLFKIFGGDANESFTLNIPHWAYENELSLPLSALRLHRAGKGRLILDLEVSNTPIADDKRFATMKKYMWQSWLEESVSEAAAKLTLAQLMDALAIGRLAYFRFKPGGRNDFKAKIILYGQDNSGEIREICATVLAEGEENRETKHQFGGIYEKILITLLGGENNASSLDNLENYADDRCRSISSIVLSGGPSEAGNFDPVLHRLADLDEFGEYFNYDPQFCKNQLQDQYVYDRYHRFGSHYLASGHHFCFLGHRGSLPQNHADLETPWFVEHYIHDQHMPQIYKNIWLLFLFQQLAFHRFSMQLPEVIAKNDHEDDRQPLKEINIAINRFLAYFCPQELSTQVQGRELSSHLRKALGVKTQLDDLQKRVRDFEFEVATEKAEREARRRSLLYYFGLPLAFGVIIFSFLGLDFSQVTTRGYARLLEALGAGRFFGFGLAALMAVVISYVFVALAGKMLAWRKLRKWRAWVAGSHGILVTAVIIMLLFLAAVIWFALAPAAPVPAPGDFGIFSFCPCLQI